MNPVGSGFAGSVPDLYERYMVPLMFEVYAVDLAARVGRLKPSRVLEIAAGTGAATRQLARELPVSATIVATDLNQPMLDHAAAIGTARAVAWRQADVMRLPFPDGSFDVVACQFGAMFFPDKPRAYAEVRRVLLPGGSSSMSGTASSTTNSPTRWTGPCRRASPMIRRASWRVCLMDTTIPPR